MSVNFTKGIADENTQDLDLCCFDKSSVSGILQLTANWISYDLVPIHFGAGKGKQTTQSFECGLRHGLVVLSDSILQAEPDGNESQQELVAEYCMAQRNDGAANLHS